LHSTCRYYDGQPDLIDNHVQDFPVGGMRNRAYFFVAAGIRARFAQFSLTGP
jgi:hypothetical protein